MKLLFTDSELCALHRIRDLVLPGFVTSSDTDDVRMDVIALRGLAARELIAFDAGEVRPSAALEQVLAPCADPVLVAEVTIERDGEITYAGLVRAADGGSSVFAARPWGLLSVEPATASATDLLGDLCQLDQVGAVGHHATTVNSRDYLHADELLAAGSPDAAVDLLVSSGASLGVAHAWLGAVEHRLATVMVTVARTAGTGPFLAIELGWLVAQDGTAWQISTAELGSDWDQPAAETVTTLRQVGAGTLRDALADVCEAEPVGAAR